VNGTRRLDVITGSVEEEIEGGRIGAPRSSAQEVVKPAEMRFTVKCLKTKGMVGGRIELTRLSERGQWPGGQRRFERNQAREAGMAQ
jgi:hypothetical protein